MRRVAGVLLVLFAGSLASAPPAAAQPDERLGKARRLQEEATADFRAGRPNEGVPKAREALALREAALGPHHGDVAESASTLADLLRAIGDYPAAHALHARALAIRERVLGPRHPLTGASLSSLGYVTFLMGDPAAARPLVERGLEIRTRALGPRHVAVSGSLNDLGLVLAAQGDYKGARAAYERALAIREGSYGPDNPLTAVVLRNLAETLRETGDRAAARPYLLRALKIREASGNQPAIAETLNSLGMLTLADGDVTGARTYLERALDMRERVLGPEHALTAVSLNDLGVLFLRTSRYPEARAAFERSLRIREKALGPEHTAVAMSLRNLGEVTRVAGDPNRARVLLERALAIYDKRLGPEHPATALTLYSLAFAVQRQGDLAGARTRFERALASQEKVYGPASTHVAMTLSALAHLSRMQGKAAEALVLAERAVRVHEQALGPDHPAVAWELSALGYALRATGNGAAAQPVFERALALGKKAEILDVQWRAASGLGGVYEKRGRLLEAVAMYRVAAQTLEQMARRLDEGGRAQLLQSENRLSVYDALARVLLRLHERDQGKGYDREAFAALEAKKGRVVAEALGAAQGRLGDPRARRDAEDVRATEDRVLGLERALREEQDKAPAEQSAETVKELATRLTQTKSEYLAQVHAFLARYPKYRTMFVDQQTVDPKVLAKFADRLPAGTLVVQYFAAPDALYLFLVSAGGKFQVKSQPVKQDDLYDLVRRYRAHLKAAEAEWLPWHDDGSAVYRREVLPLKEITAKLSGQLLAPIAGELAAYSNVVFVPNDLLLYLPLHALTRRAHGRERFLAESHVVSYLTQLELLDLLAPAKPQPDAPLLALANPDGTLPAASREVRALRDVRKAVTALEGDQATKQEFLRLASTFPQLHLATHGVLDPERPERSYLLVAGADEASQRLSIGEIAGLSLPHGLAILSACDTAVGEQVPGAALITLAAAFSQAGAEAIVASLWKVNDAATRDFMVTFHRELGAGQAAALHRAQLDILGRPRTAHPYYWAAFILIGAR